MLRALQAHLDLKIGETRLAQLGQLAENQVVGAPCGIMDQIAVTSGRSGNLTHILCRPGSVEGRSGCAAGRRSSESIRWSSIPSAAAPMACVRIGAFMGRKIINARRAAAQPDADPLSDGIHPGGVYS